MSGKLIFLPGDEKVMQYRKRKKKETRKKRKKEKGKKSYECSVASFSSGWLGEDKINIKNTKQTTTSTIWQAFIFPMLQGSKLVHRNYVFPTMITLS